MKVYIITPSWLIKKKKEFVNGIKTLEKLGFRIINKNVLEKLKKIPSTKEKVRQIHNAFLNKEVDLILAQRGGYGTMKLLPHLDFNLIRNNPKIFAGFSDISTLLNVIYERTGLVTLHSPMIINFSPVTKFTVNSFLNAVNNFPQKNLFDRAPVNVYRQGIAKGILKGGNLITLTALLGTDWEINTEGAILFFEEVEEKLHGIDRCLTQWILKGKFKKIRGSHLKGLILGDFRGFKTKDVYKILTEQMEINFPVVHCPYIGHTKNKITLPVGARVELNTYKKFLILELNSNTNLTNSNE